MTGKLFRTCLIITLHILLCGFPSLLGAEVAVKDGIIPRPAEISFKSGVFGYDGTRGKFRIRLVSGGSPESYTLKVTPDSVLIEASDSAGVFYAMQTIGFLADTAAGVIPCVEIRDEPRFRWRGICRMSPVIFSVWII